jgi:hypothetical protein
MAKKIKNKEQDGVYFLKLVLYMILGAFWLKISSGEQLQIPIPIGLLTGLVFIRHEHFQIDRKIEYAVLLISAFVGFWLPFGMYISL